MIGMILAAATPNATGFIAGQAFSGIGTAIQELMAVTVSAEIVPTNKRGFYVAILVYVFIPFASALLYGALIARASWRYCACAIAIWNFATAVVVCIFYSPPPRTNLKDLTTFQKVKRIDLLGGFLLAAGLVILLVGINAGGQMYAWSSGRVVALLTVGLACFAAMGLHELRFACSPTFPRRLLRHPRPFVALLVVDSMKSVIFFDPRFTEIYSSLSFSAVPTLTACHQIKHCAVQDV